MKRFTTILIAVILIVALAGCSGATAVEDAATNYFAEYPGSRIIAFSDLAAKIDAGDNPFILSIRQKEDYDAGHITGAYNAVWGSDLAEKVAMLPTDETVYVYCYSGQTAGQTVALLNMLGIKAVSVKSGMNGIKATDGYEAYIDTASVTLEDAGAKLDKTVLTYVEDYFNAIADSGSNIISADAVAPLIDAGDVVVVDIRTADDYAKAHIDGAVNIPFGANMTDKFENLPMDQQIVVTCYSGQTAGQTVAIMRALGYDAISLKSGFGGWTSFVKEAAATNYFAEYPGSRIISFADLATKIDAGENPFILSIRSQADYDAGHVTGAYNAAWGTSLAEKIAMLPTDETVYVYCYSGQTAGQTVAILNMMGVEAISVKSGMNGIKATDGYEAYIDTVAVELPDAKADLDDVFLLYAQGYFNAIPDSGSNIIAADAAKVRIDAEEVVVVDIRTAADYAAGHIKGAINIPFGANMTDGYDVLSTSDEIIVTCYSGQTAGQTIAVLRTLGYDAISLKSGMGGWTGANYPVVTE